VLEVRLLWFALVCLSLPWFALPYLLREISPRRFPPTFPAFSHTLSFKFIVPLVLL
jgi:hypothetical protein